MIRLSQIQNTIQQVAEAITAALDLETEIVDETLQIVGGTGRYIGKIGQYEEDGKLDSPYIYSRLLRNPSLYINRDTSMDSVYNPLGGELAEICCPIIFENKAIGLIGLIAFTPEQRKLLLLKEQELISFLKIMAKLIVGQFITTISNDLLNERLDSLLDISPMSSSFDLIVGESKTMQELKHKALQISSTDSTVLITGESGTGKELFARAISNVSPRSKMPFISINCAAIPEMLFESELFGYEKGSFTGADNKGKLGKFQLADKGTLFLDEIGDMPLHLQGKLLRVLQNNQIDKIGGQTPIDIDVRIIAATNRNLEEMIQQNTFREDLYFRLNVIPLHIPPLRERPEDISSLINYAFNKFNTKLGKKIKGISPDAYNSLSMYSWPGNARELENAIEFALNMETSLYIQTDNLPDKIRCISSTSQENCNYKNQTKSYKKQVMIDCLNQTGWSLEGKKKAAKILGISLSTLYLNLRSK